MRRLCLLGFLFVAISENARADIIFSNFGPGDSYGSVAWQVGTTFVTQNAAARFTLGPTDMFFSSAQIAVFSAVQPNLLTFQVLTNDGSNLPGTVLENLAASNIPTSPSVITFDATSPLLLSANTTYWLASDVYGAGDFGWMYNSTGETGLATRLDLGPWIGGTSSGDPTPAFRINGTSAAVPEPPTLALVGIGLVVLWGYSRFKNRV